MFFDYNQISNAYSYHYFIILIERVVKHVEGFAETKPTEIRLHGTDRATKLWRYWMTQEPADFGTLLGNGKKLNPLIELAKKLTFTSDFTMAAIFSLIDDILPKEKADKIKEITRKCDEELTVCFDNCRLCTAAAKP